MSIETVVKKDIKNLVAITTQEQKSNTNNESLPEVYDSYELTILSAYLQTLKDEFYDVDKYVNLFDDIRYFEELNPIVERIHKNLEISMHNKALYEQENSSDEFKQMLYSYYVINDIECDLIDTFIELITKHIESSDKMSPTYVETLTNLKKLIDFKYNSNINSYGVGLPLTEEQVNTITDDYLENMIIRCILEIAKFSNEDLENDLLFAKSSALEIYLETLLSFVKDIFRKQEYEKISTKVNAESTAKGIISTAFIQEHHKSKKLVKDDDNE